MLRTAADPGARTYRPASPSPGRVLRTNLRWALGWSLPMALLYCVRASVVALLRRSGHFAQYGVTLRTVIGTCLIGGLRPLLELEPTSYPLAVEQREGITAARVREIARLIPHAGAA